MHVIGAGVGRTGTASLKLATNQLGFGPCHHMEAVLRDMPVQVPLWSDALNGKPDWQGILSGFASAVDWPSARYFRELGAAYPSAKFLLTIRDPGRWADRFAATIYQLIAGRDHAPSARRAWLEMAGRIIAETGFPEGLDQDQLAAADVAHIESVKAAIPADRLLVCQVKDGWDPLCRFLGVPVPEEPLPQTDHRAEFRDRVTGRI